MGLDSNRGVQIAMGVQLAIGVQIVMEVQKKSLEMQWQSKYLVAMSLDSNGCIDSNRGVQLVMGVQNCVAWVQEIVQQVSRRLCSMWESRSLRVQACEQQAQEVVVQICFAAEDAYIQDKLLEMAHGCACLCMLHMQLSAFCLMLFSYRICPDLI